VTLCAAQASGRHPRAAWAGAKEFCLRLIEGLVFLERLYLPERPIWFPHSIRPILYAHAARTTVQGTYRSASRRTWLALLDCRDGHLIPARRIPGDVHGVSRRGHWPGRLQSEENGGDSSEAKQRALEALDITVTRHPEKPLERHGSIPGAMVTHFPGYAYRRALLRQPKPAW